jgi:putative ABC transport system substrate-binding protein
MNRPGHNVTGVSRLSVTLEPKRLELLHELSPATTVIGLLVNPTNPRFEVVARQMEESARALGLRLQVLKATSEGELESAFANLVPLGVAPAYNRWLGQIIALASGHAIPTMYATRDIVVAGGLVSYDASTPDSFRQVGVYVGRILKGEKPAELPVLQPTKFELAINLKTAKALGLTVPPSLLARADEVIE